MKRFYIPFLIFAMSISFAAPAKDILLKNGSSVRLQDVLSRDQFGIMAAAKKDEKTGAVMRRFISFPEMNPASLSNFPFCDVKAVERTYNAVQDRATLIREKFASQLNGLKDVTDYSKELTIHTGVPSYNVLFMAEKALPDGMIGTIYSDSADSVFYGKIFLYGMIGESSLIWIGEVYPGNGDRAIDGKNYREFTVIQPEKKPENADMENEKRPRRQNAEFRNEGTAKDGEKKKDGPDGQMPPPPQDGKGPDGQMPPPPQDGKGPNGQMPPTQDGKRPPRKDAPRGGERMAPPPGGGNFGGGMPGGNGPAPR